MSHHSHVNSPSAWRSLVTALLLLASSPLPAAETTAAPANAADCPQSLRYTFSWSQQTDCNFGPRGGTSKGAPLTLDTAPHAGWLALQQPGLSVKEKDRRAILAMAGPYRTSFEFLETVLYAPTYFEILNFGHVL